MPVFPVLPRFVWLGGRGAWGVRFRRLFRWARGFGASVRPRGAGFLGRLGPGAAGAVFLLSRFPHSFVLGGGNCFGGCPLFLRCFARGAPAEGLGAPRPARPCGACLGWRFVSRSGGCCVGGVGWLVLRFCQVVVVVVPGPSPVLAVCRWSAQLLCFLCFSASFGLLLVRPACLLSLLRCLFWSAAGPPSSLLPLSLCRCPPGRLACLLGLRCRGLSFPLGGWCRVRLAVVCCSPAVAASSPSCVVLGRLLYGGWPQGSSLCPALGRQPPLGWPAPRCNHP